LTNEIIEFNELEIQNFFRLMGTGDSDSCWHVIVKLNLRDHQIQFIKYLLAGARTFSITTILGVLQTQHKQKNRTRRPSPKT
jgi:hypothetical protein